ncbi:MAG: type II toxin-antitoxin system HicB family antitoxin [Phycisphaerales bacterium]
MTTHRYTVILDREPDGGFHASCPALPGCHSQGDSLDEALQNVREAIEVYLESLTAHNEPFPREDMLFTPVEVSV